MRKSAGIDGLAAEHFVYSHERISVHLAMLFTSMLTHGYLPDAFMATLIIPILKTKTVTQVLKSTTDRSLL